MAGVNNRKNGPVGPTGIEEAVQKAGSQADLAKLLGVSQQFVSTCLKKGHVPLLRAVEIEMQLGVPRRRLISKRIASLLDLREVA